MPKVVSVESANIEFRGNYPYRKIPCRIFPAGSVKGKAHVFPKLAAGENVIGYDIDTGEELFCLRHKAISPHLNRQVILQCLQNYLMC